MKMDRDRGIEKHVPLRRVEFHILLSLAAGERHGYGIIQDIEARGAISVPDVGTMYRALARMVEAGLKEGTKIHLVALWFRALIDSLRNGPAERARPAASWRRGGNWGYDIELVRRRLARSPIFAATTIGTLTIGLSMFAVVYTAVQKI